MPPPTDQHDGIADAVKAQLAAALAAAGVTIDCHAAEDLSKLVAVKTLPFVACVPVGPEQERADWTTNARDGIGFPVAAAYMTSGATDGEKSPAAGGMTMTQFRRLLWATFHNQRLASFTPECVCEVSSAGEIWDKDDPAHQKLQTVMIVTAVGRFPRGS